MSTYLWLLLLLFIGGVGGLSYWIADQVLYARREPLSRTPACEGLAFEEVSFSSRFGLQFKGWWIPADPPGALAVLLLHPFGGNRQGLSHPASTRFPVWQPPVDLLALARTFHDASYGVLLFDFRSHGESERALCAGGFTEDQDVVAAVDYVFQRLHEELPNDPPAVSVVGVGTGATAILVAVGREKGSTETWRFFSGDSEGGSGFVEVPPPNVKRIRCVVAVEPGSMRSYLRRGMRWTSLFSIGLIPCVDWWCRQRGGYPLETGTLRRLVGQIHIPVFLLGCSQQDNTSEVSHLHSATMAPNQPGWFSDHPETGDGGKELCPEAILAFVDKYTHRLT